MLKLQTELEGKRTYFGQVQKLFRSHGYTLCGNWEYTLGKFDTILHREGGETIYLRIPFSVLDGELDHDDAYLQFRTPYVIKHVVNIGLDRDQSSLLTAMTNQFQEPLDTDAHIHQKSKWEHVGLEAVNRLVEIENIYH